MYVPQASIHDLAQKGCLASQATAGNKNNIHRALIQCECKLCTCEYCHRSRDFDRAAWKK